MIKGKYLITAGIAAAVLALTACSGGQGSASGKETQKTAAQKAEAGAEAQASQYVKFKPEEAKEVMDSDGSTHSFKQYTEIHQSTRHMKRYPVLPSFVFTKRRPIPF